MYSNRQIQEQLLQLDTDNENPAFGFRPRQQQPMPLGYADERQYSYPSQQPHYDPPRGNGGLKLLAFLVGIAVCAFAVIIAMKMNVLPKALVIPTPAPAVSAPIVHQSGNAQQAAPPVQQQQVEQVPVQVLPTAQVPVATAIPAQAQVTAQWDHRLDPTATPEPIKPTVMPVPAYTASQEGNQQCIDVPSANNKVCDAPNVTMDKATQEWVASMIAAGHIHPPTETTK